ncbi:hypothetical protein NDU88_003399 [Pleurodeles waltl]|uniref:Uncharacterized protein n=1 Tax=Pleurodeles waltl TaxID=8319 RepID=A0AAV7RE73_PLEWA|nr:hypothetical protein NDU88_003399 [Pleurodeles waltl]
MEMQQQRAEHCRDSLYLPSGYPCGPRTCSCLNNPPSTPASTTAGDQELQPPNNLRLLSPLHTAYRHTGLSDSTRNTQPQSDVPANTWGSLLSTLDVMATAIKHQADKQDIQVDLVNITAKYIVGIDSKLQALNDLIQREPKNGIMYKWRVAVRFQGILLRPLSPY